MYAASYILKYTPISYITIIVSFFYQDTCPAVAFLMTTRLLQALEIPLGV